VGGSYAIEALTDRIEDEVTRQLRRIENLGGMLSAIESGCVQAQIHESAYSYQRSIESRDRIVVGVNEFRMEEEQKIPIHLSDPAVEAGQLARLSNVRRSRDANVVTAAIERLEHAARGTQNLMPHILEAVEAYASVGEISDAFRRVHGEYRETWTA
jgi:methylmalonyl-CoA mutase N-terminal domain/subunit